ncbi:hypothetical protein FO519_009285, partial [Halicephalobus sp. NKZ332]
VKKNSTLGSIVDTIGSFFGAKEAEPTEGLKEDAAGVEPPVSQSGEDTDKPESEGQAPPENQKEPETQKEPESQKEQEPQKESETPESADEKKPDEAPANVTDTEAAKNETKSAEKPKPKIVKTKLNVAFYQAHPDLTKSQVDESKQILSAFEQVEREKSEREAAHNELEARVYDLQDRLSSEEFLKFVREEELKNLTELVQGASKWLDEDVDPKTKTEEFVEKRKPIDDVYTVIQKRIRDDEERPRLLEKFNEVLNKLKEMVNKMKTETPDVLEPRAYNKSEQLVKQNEEFISTRLPKSPTEDDGFNDETRMKIEKMERVGSDLFNKFTRKVKELERAAKKAAEEAAAAANASKAENATETPEGTESETKPDTQEETQASEENKESTEKVEENLEHPEKAEEEKTEDQKPPHDEKPSIIDISLTNSSVPKTDNLNLRISSGKSVSCKKFKSVTPTTAATPFIHLEQGNPFVPASLIQGPQKIRVFENCGDGNGKTMEAVKNRFHGIQLFGKETALFKGIELEGRCERLLPLKSSQIRMGIFLNPLIGNVFVVNSGGQQFLVGNTRSLFDSEKITASVRFSKNYVKSAGCLDFEKDLDLETPLYLRPQKEKRSQLEIIRLDSFSDFDDFKSIQIDLGWIKNCANFSSLFSGAVEGRISLRSHNIASSRKIGTLEIHEYPLSGFTELVFVHSKQKIKNVAVHRRPIDSSIVSGPPCSESNIGSKIPTPSEKILKSGFISEKDITTVTERQLLVGDGGILDLTVLAELEDGNIACGTTKILDHENRVAMAFFNDTVKGSIKMVR